MSKSVRGITSTTVAITARINATLAFWQTQKEDMNTAIKQERLHAAVFPFVKGI